MSTIRRAAERGARAAAGGQRIPRESADGYADILIWGGVVVDGTGSPRKRLDIVVKDGVIAALDTEPEITAKAVVDASGMTVVPGFIDAHNHSVPQMVEPPLHLDENFIRQGVTTVVGGPDGEFSPSMMQELLARYGKTGLGPNVAMYVGHNGVRTEVMGSSQDRAPTAAELREMQAHVREGMQIGAVGFSTGLMYSPGLFSATDEVVAMAKEAAPFGGIYESHVRDPHRALLQSNWEAIEIGRQAKIAVDLTHLTTPGKHHRGLMKEVIRQIEAARADGVHVVADQYPYHAVAVAPLHSILKYPVDLGVRGLTDAKIALWSPERRELIRRETLTGGAKGYSGFKASGATSVLILVCPGQEQHEGRFLSEVAAERQRDGFDTAADLIVDVDGEITVSQGGFYEEDVRLLMVQPWTMIASDGAIPGQRTFSNPHPRYTCTFPRVLGHYVRELRLLTLEDAIRKMTSAPADFLGLTGRGSVRVGATADLVIFDAESVEGPSTWKSPLTPPTGISTVIVNGTPVLREGLMTGATPGRFLKRGGGSQKIRSH